jgi:hypothetical protein
MCNGKRSFRRLEEPLEEIQRQDLEKVKVAGQAFKAELQCGDGEVQRMVRRIGSGR